MIEDIIFASGNYLWKALPRSYETWEESELLEYISQHACEVYETCDPKWVMEQIEGLAHSVQLYLEKRKAS